MRKILEISRRSFLRIFGLLGLSLTGRRRVKARPVPAALDSYKVLSAEEVKTLEALVDQLIPKDEFPAATEAGVVRYIDYALSTGQDDRFPLYQKGLAATNDAARAENKRDYHKLSFDDQKALLKKIENGDAPGKQWEGVSQKLFFEFLWKHTLEGYYGPPQYGGNKDYTSWNMVGYPELHGLEPKLEK